MLAGYRIFYMRAPKRLDKHKRSTQYMLHSNEGSLNLILWKYGASVLFVDNDFDANAKALITSKINDKRKKYHGIRSNEANEAIRCYKDVHNNVNIHNQYLSYVYWDYRTRRKQMGVPFMIWLQTLYILRLASHFSIHMQL